MKLPAEPYFDDEFVEKVRQKILSTYAENAHLYDPNELDDLRYNNWYIRRFLRWSPTTVDQAVKMVQECMKWRAKIGISRWSDSDFPVEFYQSAACFRYLPDKDDINVLVVRLKMNKRDQLLKGIFEELARKYLTYIIDRLVVENPHRGVGIIFDCHGASLSNVDLENCRYLISTLSNYFGGVLTYICIYELPWILNQLWKLVRSWLDPDAKKIIRFASKKDIHQMIDLDHLPDYMGGTSTVSYRSVPKNVVLTIEDVVRRAGYSGSEMTKIVGQFRKHMED